MQNACVTHIFIQTKLLCFSKSNLLGLLPKHNTVALMLRDIGGLVDSSSKALNIINVVFYIPLMTSSYNVHHF